MRTTAFAAVVVLLLAGCGGDDREAQNDRQTPTSVAPSSPSASEAVPDPAEEIVGAFTPELDSIAVLGHSGATGANSDPDHPGTDARSNSWATGDSPKVDSVYKRLLDSHPALKDHNYNGAVDGSRVDNLELQLASVLRLADPVPDVVIIQTIDNDMRCDGTDEDNYAYFGETLDEMIGLIQERTRGAQVFIVSQWADVEEWSSWAVGRPDVVAANSDLGPCTVFRDGKVWPKGVRTMQELTNGYFEVIEDVCAAHDGCFTDQRALQQMQVVDADVSSDGQHLSIAGNKKMAALAFAALPEEITDRP
ncbi:SGNH/GDSL hydrolase family protein [Nocardioides bigeumensis]|uniref:SGNH hydrolase-type esterase domain-containing protein n=1 Tax=Nocardioides bigeumensis TaxID=433657 RepID=A0ABN2YJW0_9ACTN